MEQTPFSQVIADLREQDGRYRVALTPDWMQGRATYGGLSAALGLEAATRAIPDLPPLRSAQIAFIGPSGDAAEVTVKILRRGRSVVFVESDVVGVKGLATRCLLCFGASRSSSLTAPALTPPQMAPPDSLPEFMNSDLAPIFTRHFETRLVSGARPGSGSRDYSLLAWVRHKDPAARGTTVGLLGLADMLPPPMLSTLTQMVPISSMTWHIDFLAPEPADDGWRLLLAEAESAAEGYSTQHMVAWDSRGQPLLISRQSIAVFDR